ncbi:MAG: hypothetical protein ACYTF8_12665 [Planctomycetota bacterium]
MGHNVFTDFGREWLKQLAVWSTMATPIPGQVGAAATVIAGAPAGQKRVGGLTGMIPAYNGYYINLINSGDNDGAFLIANVIDANTADVVDASPGTIPDANNGTIEWTVSIESGDAAVDQRRFRWLGAGSGALLELTSVSALSAPLTITTGPDEYIRAMPAPTFPTTASALFTVVFPGGVGPGDDFWHHGASVDVSEAGIFVDVHDGAGTQLSPAVANQNPVAYKSFAPLTKLAALSLTFTWEFRF